MTDDQNTAPFDASSIEKKVLGDPLTLTAYGHTFVAPPASTALVAKLIAAMSKPDADAAALIIEGYESPLDLYRELWGAGEWRRIIDPENGIPWAFAQLMGAAAILDAAGTNRDAVLAYWRSGGDLSVLPKAPRRPTDRQRKSGKKQRSGSKKR